jgi:uncharacterized surface protein with fasciclin (FAS1) repeats
MEYQRVYSCRRQFNRRERIDMQPTLVRRSALLAMGSLALVACGGGDSKAINVLDTLTLDADTTTLADAIRAAGLDGTLAGSGPFTVFAPTNAAFAALLTEIGLTRDQLFANRALLSSVLSYHVLPGRVARAQVPAGKAITALSAGFFKIDAAGSGLQFTDGRNRTGRVTTTDIDGVNGVIHKLDRVMLPADKTLVQTAQGLSDFSILVEAVVAANLVTTLSGTGPFTVFAPTNAAFAALLTELRLTKAELLADTALLARVLTYHVLPSRVLKADVPVGPAIATVQGSTFTVDAGLAITDRNGRKAAITGTDVLASNGVIHVIDRVILP